MGQVIKFEPKNNKNEQRKSIIKIVDGKPVECVNVDMLSSEELDKYLIDPLDQS